MDYELIDTGNGRRLERFGKFILDRPDPQIVWDKKMPPSEWEKFDAKFERTIEDKGRWVSKKDFPASWIISHNDINLVLKLSPFKHSGVFPEQSWEWDMLYDKITNSKKQVNVLNLFGYTGAASLFALKAGAKVTHVDASRPAISWFRENLEANNYLDKPIRFIPEDSQTFVEREIKRGNKYEVIIMDPPVYGHGPKGQPWAFNKDFPHLLESAVKLFSDNPLMLIVNAYAVSSSSISLANIIQDKMGSYGGEVTNGELTLTDKSKRILSTGIWSIWSKRTIII